MRWLTLWLAITLVQTGCAAFQDWHYGVTNECRANWAWYGTKYDKHAVGSYSDFRRGWRQGYYEVSLGRCARPPAVPPKCYWSAHTQNPEGAAAINAWYQGFQEGAIAAERDGFGYRATLPAFGGAGGPEQPPVETTEPAAQMPMPPGELSPGMTPSEEVVPAPAEQSPDSVAPDALPGAMSTALPPTMLTPSSALPPSAANAPSSPTLSEAPLPPSGTLAPRDAAGPPSAVNPSLLTPVAPSQPASRILTPTPAMPVGPLGPSDSGPGFEQPIPALPIPAANPQALPALPDPARPTSSRKGGGAVQTVSTATRAPSPSPARVPGAPTMALRPDGPPLVGASSGSADPLNYVRRAAVGIVRRQDVAETTVQRLPPTDCAGNPEK